MAKQAHITSHPQVAVGERHMALCGKGFKVKVLWEDVPKDKPICRDCVDMALLALTDADLVIQQARMSEEFLRLRLKGLTETLNPDDLVLDVIAEFREDFEDKEREKRERKELEARQQTSCTCTWKSAEVREVDENCPIHGTSATGTGHDDNKEEGS